MLDVFVKGKYIPDCVCEYIVVDRYIPDDVQLALNDKNHNTIKKIPMSQISLIDTHRKRFDKYIKKEN